MYSSLVHISCAQQRSISVAYFQLQLRKAAEMAAMITLKGMAQSILWLSLLWVSGVLISSL